MKKLYQASTYEESWLFVDDDKYTLEELSERFRKRKIESEYKQMRKDYIENPDWYDRCIDYIYELKYSISFYKSMPISVYPVEEVDRYKIILEEKESD